MNERTRKVGQTVINITFPATALLSAVGVMHIYNTPAGATVASFDAVQEQRLQAVETLAVGTAADVTEIKGLILKRITDSQERSETRQERIDAALTEILQRLARLEARTEKN